jgi:hypothetical protein
MYMEWCYPVTHLKGLEQPTQVLNPNRESNPVTRTINSGRDEDITSLGKIAVSINVSVFPVSLHGRSL